MKFLDCFAGIGGFRLGMERAGHTCVGHIEIDRFAQISYHAIHRPKEEEFNATDITRVDARELPQFDILCGGFPCQAFSIAGKRRGFEDTRGTLFFDIARIAKERQPQVIFLENVRGLLNHDNGRTFAVILSTLSELGYHVEWQVLNSKHFGVPQNRERVFIIGHLRRECAGKIFPIKGNSKEIDAIKEQTTNTLTARYTANGAGSYIIESQPPEIKQIVGGKQGQRIYDSSGISVTLSSQGGGQGATTGLYAIPVLTPERVEKRQNGRRFKEPEDEMFTLTSQDRHGVAIYQSPRGFNKEGYHQIAPTLTAKTYQHNNHLIENMTIRRLTPLECFRLQGFPDWAYERAKEAGVSDSQLYKQAGNSVTVNVIYEIAKRIGETK